MPYQWREPSNPAYNRPGKRKFSEAQLLDPHLLTGNGNGGGPLSKRRRGGSPAPFPQPRSPVVHGRNHSNPWQARTPSTLSGRERDKEKDRDRDRDRDRDASSDLMDGTMSAKSSPILRPTSSHGLGGALGLNGISIGSSLLGLQHTNANGSGGNGNGGGGAGVGIPINIPLHTPTSSIGIGMSPGGPMSVYMMGSGLGGSTGGSPGLRPMHRLPKRGGAGGQQGKGVQEGVGGLRIQGNR